jgi:hypothetical protein
MLQVTENELKNRLAFDNPWWVESAVPQRFRDWPKRAYLAGLHVLVAGPVRRAAVLLGPRRVGKTVLLQQLIERLIDDATQPRRFFMSRGHAGLQRAAARKLLALFRKSRTQTVGRLSCSSTKSSTTEMGVHSNRSSTHPIQPWRRFGRRRIADEERRSGAGRFWTSCCRR